MRAWALVSRSLAFLIVLAECMFADHGRDGQLPTCVSRHTHAPPGAWQEILLIQLSYEMIPADLACAVPPVPVSPRQARFPFWDRHLPNWDFKKKAVWPLAVGCDGFRMPAIPKLLNYGVVAMATPVRAPH